MPGLDGTGPFGTGQPGKGFGPCGRHGVNRRHRLRNANAYRNQLRRRNRLFSNTIDEGMYEFTPDELANRRAALQKELQWVEARIQEMENTDENSDSSQ